MTLIAFPDPARPKSFYIDRVRRHREADELVRGTGWDVIRHRGCAVGCTLETYDHSLYPTLLGVPEQIAYLQDWLFENLPEDHQTWPERFLEAIPEGADLSGVYPAWIVRLMIRNLGRIGDGDEPWRTEVRASIVRVRDLFALGMPDESAAESAARLAWSAAESAWSAAWSAARSAVESAAWSAAESVESAARSAESAEILRQAEDLLDLLRSAPAVLVPEESR